jgi:hypothetical protein
MDGHIVVTETCRVLMMFLQNIFFNNFSFFFNVDVKVCLKEVHELVLDKVNPPVTSSFM